MQPDTVHTDPMTSPTRDGLRVAVPLGMALPPHRPDDPRSPDGSSARRSRDTEEAALEKEAIAAEEIGVFLAMIEMLRLNAKDGVTNPSDPKRARKGGGAGQNAPGGARDLAQRDLVRTAESSANAEGTRQKQAEDPIDTAHAELERFAGATMSKAELSQSDKGTSVLSAGLHLLI